MAGALSWQRAHGCGGACGVHPERGEAAERRRREPVPESAGEAVRGAERVRDQVRRGVRAQPVRKSGDRGRVEADVPDVSLGGAYRGGIAANVFATFSRRASTDRTPASMYRSPASGVDFRASPQVPDFVAQCTEPGLVKKNAVCTGPMGTVYSGNGGNSAFARSRSTRSGLMRMTAEVSPRFACRPLANPENSATSAAVNASQ